MKRSRLIASLFALTLFVSGAPFAHAQTDPALTPPDVSGQLNQLSQQNFSANQTQINQQTQNSINQNLSNNSTLTGNTIPDSAAASPTALNGDGPSLFTDPLDYIMVKLMSLFAWLLGIAAITLDNAMYYTVVHMGSYVNSLSAVGVAWRILRDIGNIILIFGFLALGISVILDVDWYGGGTKMLPILLLSAIFLNFSLFAAEAVIDTGNLFATEFYTQINGGTASAPVDFGSQNIHNEGISNAVMNQLGLQGFYNGAIANNSGSNANAIFQSGHPFILGFLALLVFLVAAFVFFSLAFILIARFVFLIFLIIVAPVGIAGLAVPKLDKLASQWWSSLFEQTITAPVMLLMLYVALAVITDAQFLTGFGVGGGGNSASSNVAQNAWIAAVTDSTGTNVGALGSVLLSFLVAMGLLLAVTMLAKKMGAVGGSAVSKMGNSLVSGTTKFAMGSVRTAGRGVANTGRVASRYTVSLGLHSASQAVRTSALGQTQIGRIAAQTLDKGGKNYTDAKKESVKMHEEYKKSVDSAFDEKHASTVTATMKERAAAEPAATEAKKAYEAESKSAKPVVDELKRLEDVTTKLAKDKEKVESDLAKAKVARTGQDPTVSAEEVTRLENIKNKTDAESLQAQNDFAAAKARAAPVEAKLAAAKAEFDKANVPLTAALAREKDATDALAAAKKQAALGYADSAGTGFTQNPLTWTLAGPGGNAAANKIIKDTLKKMSDNEKLLDQMKKTWAKELKASEGSTEATKKLSAAKDNLKGATEKEADAAHH